jgi:hypothetical protein
VPGYLAGAFLLTLWMRALSLAGVRFGVLQIALPLLVVSAGVRLTSRGDGSCAHRRPGRAARHARS